jgi:hypothetical protein
LTTTKEELKQARLSFVTYRNRTMYLNGEGLKSWPLYFDKQGIQHIEDTILAAVQEYNLQCTYYAAHTMALSLSEQFIEDQKRWILNESEEQGLEDAPYLFYHNRKVEVGGQVVARYEVPHA